MKLLLVLIFIFIHFGLILQLLGTKVGITNAKLRQHTMHKLNLFGSSLLAKKLAFKQHSAECTGAKTKRSKKLRRCLFLRLRCCNVWAKLSGHAKTIHVIVKPRSKTCNHMTAHAITHIPKRKCWHGSVNFGSCGSTAGNLRRGFFELRLSSLPLTLSQALPVFLQCLLFSCLDQGDGTFGHVLRP